MDSWPVKVALEWQGKSMPATFRPVLLIGDGPTRDLDTRAAMSMRNDWEVWAVNRALYRHPGPIQHFVTAHVSWIAQWKAIRYNMGGTRPVLTHSIRREPGVDMVWTQEPRTGTSLMLAVLIAMTLQYELVLLAGGGLIHEDGTRPFSNDTYSAWERLAPYIQGRVFSLFGFTRKLLGDGRGNH